MGSYSEVSAMINLGIAKSSNAILSISYMAVAMVFY